MKLSENDKNILKGIACDMRRDILKMCHTCGSQNAHLGGCMSAVEVLAVLYTQIMNIRDANTGIVNWEDRDRFIMSKGHGGIAMYAAMKQAGIISQKMTEGSMRGEETVLYRHPKRNTDWGIECSSGSLGMGIGYGIGLAESGLKNGRPMKVYIMLGDGECEEGSVWEGAEYAAHRKLENLIVIIDRNRLQLDGYTKNVLSAENIEERWYAFGFETVQVNGHDLNEIYEAFLTPHSGKPLAVIANTIKGKGISFAEDKVEWHDNYLNDELYMDACAQVGNSVYQSRANSTAAALFMRKKHNSQQDVCLQNADIQFSYSKEQIKKWNKMGMKQVIGDLLYKIAEQDSKFLLLYSDCANRFNIHKLIEEYPEKCMEMGIAEQNMISAAAALAHEGHHVFAVAYAPFITARVLDQVRVNLGYMKAPVTLIGLASGFAASDLGATHTALEDVGNIRGIPNIEVLVPSDPVEYAKIIEYSANNIAARYIRVTVGNNDSIVHVSDYEFKYSEAECLKKSGDVVLVSNGAETSEVMKAAEELEKIADCQVYNLHTIKPIDSKFIESVKNCRLLVIVEEHSVIGGTASAITEQLAKYPQHVPVLSLGVPDCYYIADLPDEERRRAGLRWQDIAEEVKKHLSIEG